MTLDTSPHSSWVMQVWHRHSSCSYTRTAADARAGLCSAQFAEVSGTPQGEMGSQRSINFKEGHRCLQGSWKMQLLMFYGKGWNVPGRKKKKKRRILFMSLDVMSPFSKMAKAIHWSIAEIPWKKPHNLLSLMSRQNNCFVSEDDLRRPGLAAGYLPHRSLSELLLAAVQLRLCH